MSAVCRRRPTRVAFVASGTSFVEPVDMTVIRKFLDKR
jgi:hypothetical protein